MSAGALPDKLPGIYVKISLAFSIPFIQKEL
jgi:hypothetical protein